MTIKASRLEREIRLLKESNKLRREAIKLGKEEFKLQKLLKEQAKLDEGFYLVEDVTGKRVRKGQTQYLIKWVGWPKTANTWEPIEHLQNCLDIVENFEERSRPRGRKRKLKGTISQSNKTGDALNGSMDIFKPARMLKGDSEPLPVHTGNSNLDPISNCGSPTVISCSECDPSLNEKENLVSEKEVLDDQSKASICEANIATSVLHDPNGKSCSQDNRNFTFEASSQPHQSISCTPHDPGKVDHLKHDRNFTDLDTSTPTPAVFQHPVTDSQQVQLRAQIFVYGSIIGETKPDEACMMAAFGERNEWENVWRAADFQHQESPPLRSVELPTEKTKIAFQTNIFSTPDQAGGIGALPMKLSPLVWELEIKQKAQLQSNSVVLQQKVEELEYKLQEQRLDRQVLHEKVEELENKVQEQSLDLQLLRAKKKELEGKLKTTEEQLDSVLHENKVLHEKLQRG